MDRSRISAIAHSGHPIAAPLSDATVARLLDRALPRETGRLLDLGCGPGTWLRRALTGRPGLRAEGVDIDTAAITQGRADIAANGLAERIVLHAQDAKEFAATHRFDLVLSVGATHAFGGLRPTLEAARGHLAAGGSVLIGEGFWERQPDQNTIDAGFAADEFDDLASTVDKITTEGWTPVYGHVSTISEWDDYEWSWTGTLSGWSLDNPADPDSGEAFRAASEHRDAWMHGYRRTLGFVTLLLRETLAIPAA